MSDKSYADKRFGKQKAALEQFKLSRIEGRGGWFGLPHVSINDHFAGYMPHLLIKSPFFTVERDKLTCMKMANGADYIVKTIRKSGHFRKIPTKWSGRLGAIHGDLFEALWEHHPNVKYIQDGSNSVRLPEYSYGHLDFCCTAAKLTDEGIELKLRRLAKWWNLKSPFHLDITVCLRGDQNNSSARLLLHQTIPTIFQQVNWELGHNFATTYADTNAAMMTGFYVFRKNKRRMVT